MGSGTGAAAFSSFSSPAPSHPGTPGPTGSAGANSTLNAPASASGFMAGSAGSAAAAAAAAAVGPASLTGASGPASSSSSSASNQTANQALRKRYAQWGSGTAPDGLAAPDASTASTDKFGSTFGFTSQLLAEMLSPKNALCDQPFELKINDLLYEDFISAEELGEEDEDFKSHQRPSPVMQLFHLVFVFQAGLCTSIFRDYQTLVSHLTAAFRHEELRCGFLSEQVQILIDILDSNAILPSAGAAGTPGPGAPGLDMPAASSQDWQHHAPTTAPSFPAFADATGPPQPSVPAKARPPIPKLVTAASSPALFATSANRASSAMAAASGNSSQVLTQPAAQQLPPTLNLIDAREAITNEILRRCKLAQYVQHIFNTLRPGSSAAGVSIKVNGWIEVTLPVRPMNEPDLRLTHKDYLRRHREQRQQQQHMYHQHEPHTILNTYRAYSFGGAGSSHSNGGVVPVAEIHIPNGNTSVTAASSARESAPDTS
ncbi:hypothetical protein CAOG_00005 [Capsaspora owczarzaki ATCC 30864]|uniref:hypothetical protein n=1 Tax=Capsaspora owczarzaki (strain ATCC 30864) TaxID=595528 RepID=UPI0001FE6DF6|nr:hypothetical protein CAOG_00005 [Capsaspora owczarzaki ATCC 30864]|eukprot:XP_004364876.1 hypothetical protein CAOG_00005 [Capsaspora owczarzaki ATCC 30864]